MPDKETSNRSTFGSNVVLTTGANIFLGLLGLVTSTMAARLLGVTGRGELAAIQIWPSFIAYIAQLGLPEALVYFSARHRPQAGRYFSSATTFVMGVSCLFIAIGFLMMPSLLAKQSPEIIKAARWYLLLLVPLHTIVGMALNAFRGLNDMVLWNGLRIVPTIGWLVVLLFIYLLQQTRPEVVAAGYLVMMVVVSLPLVYMVMRQIPGPFWPDISSSKKLLRYGLPIMGSTAPELLNLRLDQMLMAGLIPAHALGLYVVAVAWSSIANPALNGLASVLFPRVAALPTSEQQVQAFAQGSRLGIVLSLLMAVPLAIATPWLLPLLFGVAYREGVPVALVLVVAGAFAGLNLILEEGLRGLGYPVAVMWSELGGLVLTIIALILLLQPMGIMGAAIASLLGYSAVTVCLVLQARRLTRCSLANLLCPAIDEIFLAWRNLQTLGRSLATKAWSRSN